ncbi:MAG: zinc-binding dehydrogenase [Sporomusaceae bacterium]|nr:zinc-binding dehydrogenase [Sporomusaceae bacterium]
MEERAEPVPGSGEVLLRVKTCGICHTDVNIAKGTYFPRHKPPLILGHELAGVVEAVGPAANVQPGDRVLVYQCITCGRCDRCREGRQNLCRDIKTLGLDVDGGYADFIKVPAVNLIKLPDAISFGEGSLIADALSTAAHAVGKLGLAEGQVLAVFGTGVLGLNAVQVAAKIYGARVVAIDREDWKLERAMTKGAWKTLQAVPDVNIPTALKHLVAEVDAAMEFVGRPETYEQAVASVRRGGRVVLVGAATRPFTVDPLRLFKDEVDISGSYASLQSALPKLIRLVETGELTVKDMISHTFSLEEINAAIDMLAAHRSRSLRAVVEM